MAGGPAMGVFHHPPCPRDRIQGGISLPLRESSFSVYVCMMNRRISASGSRRKNVARVVGLTVLAMATMAGLPSTAWALYKVVMPDGRVVYTDHPPSADTRPSAISSSVGTGADVSLPYELKQASSRSPVTLLTAAATCSPCESGRQLLKQRGIPYAEHTVGTADDLAALRKLNGGQTSLPVLQVGKKTLSGFQSQQWNESLDAAGYPKTSILPSTYRYSTPSPLTQPETPQQTVHPTAPASQPSSGTAPSPGTSNPGGIRF